MACQIFICYAMEENRDEAEAVRALLEQPGVTCWMAPDSIPPGESYARAIPDGIQSSDVVVVVFSQSADDSEDILSELTIARQHRKRIVPVRIAEAKARKLAYFLSAPNWVELHGKSRTKGEQALQRLGLEVRGSDPENPEGVPQVPPASSPKAVAPAELAIARAPVRRRRKTTAAAPARQRRLKDPEAEYVRLQKQLEQHRGLVEHEKAESAQRMWERGAACCSREKPDFQTGRQWFDKASRAGKKDGRAERRLYEQGVTAGNIDAIVCLGLLLESGERVAKDVRKAKAMYERAAESGDPEAMCRLGVLSMNGIPNGSPNYAAAQRSLRQAAALGHADAMWEMGNWFKRKHDEQNAALWYDKARARRRAQRTKKAVKREQV